MELSVFGYGGHAREVAAQINKKVTFFVDDLYAFGDVKPISSFDPKKYEIMVAVADPVEREKIVNRLPKDVKFFTFIHPTAQIMSNDVEIGYGSFIGAYSLITTNIKIGRHAILNRSNHIGHDSIVGDYFSAMPGSIVSGNVKIGNNCYIGTNSTIIEKKNICDNVIIGAGGVVVKDINESGTYVGVPANKIKK